MDPESKKLLERTYALAEENNKLLHKVRGVQKRAFLWNVVKYVIIVGITLGVFYYIEPYINNVINLYSSISGVGSNFNTIPDASSIQDLLKNL